MSTPQQFTLALAYLLRSFGVRTLRRLRASFPSVDALWQASLDEFCARGIPERIAMRFVQERRTVDPDACAEECAALQLRFIAEGEPAYPPLLREIPDAPIGVFVQGTLPSRHLALAIVGTRRPTGYGTHVTSLLAERLAAEHVVVISGLALGIDATAHRGALRAGGMTVAVLACGLDSVYPRTHTGLARELVANGGAVVSELPPGMPALRHHFPIRNRIIAGLAQGVIVTEAPERSGALLTASIGLDYNRDIFAVPGPVTSPTSAGCNALLRQGAHLIRDADDVFRFYQLPLAGPPAMPVETLSALERSVLDLVGRESVTVDHLKKISTLDTSVLNATLMLLVMKGWIRQIDPLHYLRSR